MSNHDVIRTSGSLRERFERKIGPKDPVTGCIPWLGALTGNGYGAIGGEPSTTMKSAHRVAWELSRGEITDGLFVLHHCDNRACVNPEHLWLGTHEDNMRDMANKGRSQNGSRLHPESRPRGTTHFSYTHPEKVVRGERHGNSILKDSIVQKIRLEYSNGAVTYQSLSEQYGVSKATIALIIRRKTWSHVP